MFDGDPEDRLPGLSPVCVWCRHFQPRQGRTCTAFPERDSIPLEIWLGENRHQAPYPGDHGTQFELHPDANLDAAPEWARAGATPTLTR